MTRTDWNDYDWQLIHEAPQRPALHMALDAVITDEVGAGTRPPTLRIWEWSAPAVVIGRFQSLKNEVDPEGARRHGIEVVRRVSGGGAMFIEPGNSITYSLSAPQALVHGMSFQESYAFLDAWVLQALQGLGIKAWYQPLNDIASDIGKIGGAAQARRAGPCCTTSLCPTTSTPIKWWKSCASGARNCRTRAPPAPRSAWTRCAPRPGWRARSSSSAWWTPSPACTG